MLPVLVGLILFYAGAYTSCSDHLPIGWMGKRILFKTDDPKLRLNERDHQNADDPDIPEIVVTVLQDKAGQLRIRSRGKEGWISKQDAMLLEEAIPFLTEKIRKDPNSRWSFCRRARVWQIQGEPEKAIADLTQVIRLDPKDPDAFRIRGDVWNDCKKYDQALADYNEAIRLAPADSAALNNRGLVWQRKHDFTKAVADYTEAIRLEPRKAVAFSNRGSAWNEKKEYDKSIADCTEAIRLEPNDTPGFNNRAIAWSHKHEYEKAVADYQEALRVDPNNIFGLGSLAWVLSTCPKASIRDGRRSIDLATKACELTDWKDPYCVGSLAAGCAEVGRFDEAIKWQKQAMADADYMLEERSRAEECLKRFEQKKPYRATD